MRYFFTLPFLFSTYSFASIATESLAGVTRDTFDWLNKNPASVNSVDGNLLRFGKRSGLQLISGVSKYKLGVQLDSQAEFPILSGQYSAEGAPDGFVTSMITLGAAAKSLSEVGSPVALALASRGEKVDWGVQAKYQVMKSDSDLNFDVRGSDGTLIETLPIYFPRYSGFAVTAGLKISNFESSLTLSRYNWSIATSRRSHDGRFDTSEEVTKYTHDAVTGQNSNLLSILGSYSTPHALWFVDFSHQATDLELWDRNEDKTAGAQYKLDSAEDTMTISIGGERQDTLTDRVKLFGQVLLSRTRLEQNNYLSLVETIKTSLTTTHSVELAATDWLVLRAGYKLNLFGLADSKRIIYEVTGLKRGVESISGDSIYVTQSLGSPKFGFGLIFDDYEIDAAFASNEKGEAEFSAISIGSIEVTANF